MVRERAARAGRGSFVVSAVAVLLSLGLGARVARADEPTLSLMPEPSTFTDVVDAADGDDPIDVNLTLGYVRTWELGRVQREQNGPSAADGVASRHWQDVADYSREVNQLVLGADIGIFRDLAVYAHLPMILSDDRRLSRVGGEDPSLLLTDRSQSPSPLFDVPVAGFRSPTRSGVDALNVGLAWSVLNQHRDPHVPTWVLMVEGRFNLGEPMHACNGAVAGSCLGATPPPEGEILSRGTGQGVGRGVNALRVETRGSFRYQYLEPYAGLAFQMEWPGSGDRFFVPSGGLAGYINQRPPILGRITAGAAIVPWEDREQWQRFSIDLRLTGDYVSEGHDYSPLFDALGSSTNPTLEQPVYEGQPDAATGASGLRTVNFYGLTDTQAHARLGGQLTLEMRAARYVRFSLSTAFFHSPSYDITQADACNPNVSGTGGDDRLVGTCRSGIINPHHRPVIDLPGQRFRMESVTQVDVAVNATAMF